MENGFNDIEIMMEFARMDVNESISVLCDDCCMNKVHARLLLRKASKLEKHNRVFQEWLENIRTVEYYESVMVNAGIYSFTMLYERVQTEVEFQELFIKYIPLQSKSRVLNDATLLWNKLPNSN